MIPAIYPGRSGLKSYSFSGARVLGGAVRSFCGMRYGLRWTSYSCTDYSWFYESQVGTRTRKTSFSRQATRSRLFARSVGSTFT
jgi:hypothetical protein